MGKSTKDKRDIYYRKAKEEGYRARSAFKLLQIDDEFHILDNVKRVVDLCAAPGSWSQVLSKRIYEPNRNDESVKIVAVDLQDMAPIDGILRIKGDITKMSTAEQIINYFGGEKAELVVCDGAPDVTGLHDMDQYVQSQLILAALNITTHILKPGGNFVAKIFRGKDITLMYSQLKLFFPFVTIVKPKSSRNSSLESFVLCQNFTPPVGFVPTMINPMANLKYDDKTPETGINSIIVPFLACGDLSGFDSDKNYELGNDYQFHNVVAPPIHPAYETVIQLKKQNKLDKVGGNSEVSETITSTTETMVTATTENELKVEEKLVEKVPEMTEKVTTEKTTVDNDKRKDENSSGIFLWGVLGLAAVTLAYLYRARLSK